MNLPPKCPCLPEPDQRMNHRCLTESGKTGTTAFYFEALKYGHYLWLNGHAGRSILALTRALYADVPEEASILRQWPLPYTALKWVIASHTTLHYPGNPRISFQHQATRIRGERQGLRRARAWAVWALIRKAKPALCGDPTETIEEPTIARIAEQLQNEGHTNEVTLWKDALDSVVHHRL